MVSFLRNWASTTSSPQTQTFPFGQQSSHPPWAVSKTPLPKAFWAGCGAREGRNFSPQLTLQREVLWLSQGQVHGGGGEQGCCGSCDWPATEVVCQIAANSTRALAARPRPPDLTWPRMRLLLACSRTEQHWEFCPAQHFVILWKQEGTGQ